MRKQSDSLLNVTIREISQDRDTALPYAKKDMFGLVMLFTIDRTEEAEKDLLPSVSELIDQAIKHGGTFYYLIETTLIQNRCYRRTRNWKILFPQRKKRIQKKYLPVIFMPTFFRQ